ncbi:Lipopolysaccharide heptosyltransferase 1 [Pleomorphomonas sp. T1.2MG-36]|uniref:lipopolysaccharide heptosyltransferase I n=1 Tax=Pleomorphomonas sp. T1.2MG-36 TaxID=3041167 RepID=UPI002477803B|nr:lipopolysaccharide heptosyltransferase I [Pleomorphomonas sp. T1.2MG-36]CAI9416519.1 Lipopolysaccharide heptosyltransferase 1 [Pleomorphomonas sp. T1.2MG-36]
MKVLIVKMSSMGDVVHALPALTDALKARPDVVVDWCVEAAFAPLVRLHPGVRHVHEIRLRAWRKAPFKADSWRAARALIRSIRAERYDLVIDAQSLIKSALVARFADARVAGLDAASAREPLATCLYGERHAVPRDRHAIDRLRLLFGAILGYEPDLATLDYGIAGGSGEPNPTIVLLHGTTWASKRWSTASWIELANALARRGLRPQVTYADASEEATARAIVAGAPGTELIPRAPLGEVAGLIGRATAVIGCDTGLTHLAAALDRPTVALFLSTKPGLTGVAGRRAIVLEATVPCAPCRKRDCPLVPPGTVQPCVDSLPPSRVLQSLHSLLGDAP